MIKLKYSFFDKLRKLPCSKCLNDLSIVEFNKVDVDARVIKDCKGTAE